MTLSTFEPAQDWDPAAHPSVIEAFRAHRNAVEVLVWGGDWCPDCRRQLPDLAAALDHAGVADERVSVFPVDREKNGDLVGEYDVTVIPTIVIERDGETVARFEESADRPAPVVLAEQLTGDDPGR